MASGGAPLKGLTQSQATTEGAAGSQKAGGAETGARTLSAPGDARFMLARMGKKTDGQMTHNFMGKKAGHQQSITLRGVLRTSEGKLRTFLVRALLDSGAEESFISPSFVKKIGAPVVQGDFGSVVQAFDTSAPARLTGKVPSVKLQFSGVQKSSGLSQEFHGRAQNLYVAPGELDMDRYELLLGDPFMRAHSAVFSYSRTEDTTVDLTAEDGTTTHFTGAHINGEGTAGSVGVARAARPLGKQPTGSWLRAYKRNHAAIEAEAAGRAERGAKERPDLIMTARQLEEQWAAGEQMTVTPIYSNGEHEGPLPNKDRICVRKITARAAEAAKEVEDKVLEDAMFGQLPQPERAEAEKMKARLVEGFGDVFTSDLPHISKLKKDADPEDKGVDIKTKEGAQPQARYAARMTQADTEAAGKMIQELLGKGYIRPSRSPWGAPMFLVDKPDGSKRMVIDYRALNTATIRNRYPLPRVDELFDQLQGARYFSKIDLRTGYWQILMAADAVEKTAFTSRHGHYEWLVLPMGLTNAPAEFMRLMETTFAEELNKFILVFLDDILIYSKTLEEHEKHLRVALERLRARGLHAKISKCSFFRQEVEFLGHYVGRAGVRMVEGKVEAVRAWPTPKKQKDVEQFIGLAGYYRRFIEDFSKISAPLTELCGTLKKGGPGAPKRGKPLKTFVWGKEQQQAFEALKEAVSGAPCLAMPDPARPFIVHTDASGFATGAVLMQVFDKGERPIAFLSKKMKKTERNYPVHEQELLAIMQALRAWRHYLGGRRFTIITDHQSLQYLDASAMATPRQVRWATLLSEFDFEIKYAPGKNNVVADGLSRAAAGDAPEREGAPGEDGRQRRVRAIASMLPMPVRAAIAGQHDPEYLKLLELTDEQLKARKPPMRKESGLLYRDTETGAQLQVPNNLPLRTWMMSYAHDAEESAHRGGERTAAYLKERVWWAGMAEEAQRYVRGCEACQRNKPDLQGRQGLPMSIETPGRAGEVLCMDFIGPFPRAADGVQTHVMVVIDKLTRYVMYIPLGDRATAQEVFGALDARWLAIFGPPSAIISDRDSRFTSHFWVGLWNGLRAQLKLSTAFHPQTDGQTENANRVLITALKSSVDSSGLNWATMLPQMQKAANGSVVESTGFTPNMLMFGREVIAEFDIALETGGVQARSRHPGAQALLEERCKSEKAAREKIAKAQAKQRADSMKGRRAPTIQVGDKVWLSARNMRDVGGAPGKSLKLRSLYYGPYEVLEMHGTNAARLQLPEGSNLVHPVFNLDLLKKYVDGAQEFPARPPTFDRQGPEPEEDPAAGGPASGDPIFEVERVTAKRGREARQQYRVHWKGWPAEQGSWIGKDQWATFQEEIEDFEKREAARVAELREKRPSRRRAAAAARARQPETEATRKAAVESTMTNVPRAADCPPMKNGQIDMGAQRCTADNKTGGWCKARTKYGCLCWVHRCKQEGTRVKSSHVPGAGMGLFATRDFPEGALVARYTGDLIPTRAGRRADGFGGSHYVFEMDAKQSVDAARTNTADGRMINDPKNSGKEANTRFIYWREGKRTTIRTTKPVKAGDEFLLSYGPEFWGEALGGPKKKGKQRARNPKKVIAVSAVAVDQSAGSESARVIHVRAARTVILGPPGVGVWISRLQWRCHCPVTTFNNALHSYNMPYCQDRCQDDRPPTPSPETEGAEYGSFSARAEEDRRGEAARRNTARGLVPATAGTAAAASSAAGARTVDDEFRLGGAEIGELQRKQEEAKATAQEKARDAKRLLALQQEGEAAVNRKIAEWQRHGHNGETPADLIEVADRWRAGVEAAQAQVQEAMQNLEKVARDSETELGVRRAIQQGAQQLAGRMFGRAEQNRREALARRGGNLLTVGSRSAGASSVRSLLSPPPGAQAAVSEEEMERKYDEEEQEGFTRGAPRPAAGMSSGALNRNQHHFERAYNGPPWQGPGSGYSREAWENLMEGEPDYGAQDSGAAGGQREAEARYLAEQERQRDPRAEAARQAIEKQRLAIEHYARRRNQGADEEMEIEQSALSGRRAVRRARQSLRLDPRRPPGLPEEAPTPPSTDEEIEEAEEEQEIRGHRAASGARARLTLADLSKTTTLTYRNAELPAAQRKPPTAAMTEWNEGERADTDCRGTASVLYPEQIAHKRFRLAVRGPTTCRRQGCECCAPPAGTTGTSYGHFCSCQARKQGLCRRCWIDYNCGRYIMAGQYWGP